MSRVSISLYFLSFFLLDIGRAYTPWRWLKKLLPIAAMARIAFYY